MSRIFKRGNAQVHANLTPMIDVTFLLIIFFVLVSRIVNVENEDKINLPEPKNPATVAMGDEQRHVINVLPTGNGIEAASYRLGSRSYGRDAAGVAAMTVALTALFRANPAVNVNIRADRRTHYEWIEPAMQAVSDAAGMADANISPRVNLVVLNEND